MPKQLDKTIELARWFDKDENEITITIQDYLDYEKNEDRDAITIFIFQRLYCRYLKPFQFKDEKFTKYFKNGFSIMANCCLLVETIQSFKNGWGDSNRKSGQAFKQFLKAEKNFQVFKDREQDFFENVRCGILHQGETTEGWTISRSGSKLFDEKNLIINSVKFAKEMEVSLKNYCDQLKAAKWDNEIWDNFRKKMKKIISNCEK